MQHIKTEMGKTLRREVRMMEERKFKFMKSRILQKKTSWKARSIEMWNKLPEDLRIQEDLNGFKVGLHAWVKNKIKLTCKLINELCKP